MSTDLLTSPEEQLERATSDYLAVSRGRSLFSSDSDHARAEEAAWQRLVSAQAEVAAA
ncbi:hypothetical protein [Miltoncostaea oceani]|uniref:hypothetical protein n=1 Tax=Miltoncostaea oceani TaxID=2843216 RepID=UPI001C3E5448|nr:hypothetical protein [Miltoncostaea oceani]